MALIEEIGSQLDSSREAEEVRIEMTGWEQRFDLGGEPRGVVDDFAGLLKAIQSLAYKGVRKSSLPEPGNL